MSLSTNITGTGLEHLKGLTRLSELYLEYTNVTDAGLEHLKGLTNLEERNLTRKKTSAVRQNILHFPARVLAT